MDQQTKPAQAPNLLIKAQPMPFETAISAQDAIRPLLESPGDRPEVQQLNGALFRLPPATLPPRVTMDGFEIASVPTSNESVAHLIATAIKEAHASLTDLEPYRRWAAWRLSVEAARHLGIDTSDLFVAEISTTRYGQHPWSGWDLPRTPATPEQESKTVLGEVFAWAPMNSMAINAAMIAQEIPDELSPWAVDADAVKHRKGLALRPPPVPWGRVKQIYPDGSVSADEAYSVDADPSLLLWTDFMGTLAAHLNIAAGTVLEPRAGARGMAGIDSPLLVRAAWPLPSEIEEFEMMVVEKAIDEISVAGHVEAAKNLRTLFGLRPWEAERVVALAGRSLERLAKEPIDVSKGALIHRLEKLFQNSMDSRTQIAALKVMAVAQGIARVEPEDDTAVFRKVVQNVSTGAGKRAMPELPAELPRKQG